jgi:hypothetical protein
MFKKLSMLFILMSAINAEANTAWFSGWQAYKPTNWQTIGTWHSCVSIVNISSGSVEVSISYYNNTGDIASPPLTGSTVTPKATLTPRQTVYWCTDPKLIAPGTNMWGAGVVTATPLDGQTEPALVIAQADVRNVSPSGGYNAWSNIPVNGGLPF